jgi:hypothetical protein
MGPLRGEQFMCNDNNDGNSPTHVVGGSRLVDFQQNSMLFSMVGVPNYNLDARGLEGVVEVSFSELEIQDK